MLPVQRRVRRREDFAAVAREGRRAGSRCLVVHLHDTGTSRPARAGFVVGRAVGPAVTRNRLRRRLRHLLAPHLEALPAGTDVVVRALPGAAEIPRRDLAARVEGLLGQAGKGGQR